MLSLHTFEIVWKVCGMTEAIAYVVEIKRKRVIGEGIAAELEESLVRRQTFDFLIPARKLLGL